MHNIYKTIQGRELTHTQYLKTNQGREPRHTQYLQIIQGSESSHTQYLQIYSVERTNTYQNIYKAIQGRELTHTTLFTNLLRGESQDIHTICKAI
jgi:hypothetical protein